MYFEQHAILLHSPVGPRSDPGDVVGAAEEVLVLVPVVALRLLRRLLLPLPALGKLAPACMKVQEDVYYGVAMYVHTNINLLEILLLILAWGLHQ